MQIRDIERMLGVAAALGEVVESVDGFSGGSSVRANGRASRNIRWLLVTRAKELLSSPWSSSASVPPFARA
jgi:hypothetical protein